MIYRYYLEKCESIKQVEIHLFLLFEILSFQFKTLPTVLKNVRIYYDF